MLGLALHEVGLAPPHVLGRGDGGAVADGAQQRGRLGERRHDAPFVGELEDELGDEAVLAHHAIDAKADAEPLGAAARRRRLFVRQRHAAHQRVDEIVEEVGQRIDELDALQPRVGGLAPRSLDETFDEDVVLLGYQFGKTHRL